MSIQIIYLIVKMSNSQLASEGGDGKFIATRVPHAVCLTREEGLEVVRTVCVSNIGPAKKDPCPINHLEIY